MAIFDQIYKKIGEAYQKKASIGGVTQGAEAFILAQMATDKGCVFVARDDKHLAHVREYLAILSKEASILEFPSWDVPPYSRNSPSHYIQSLRLGTLHQLSLKDAFDKKPIILTTVRAATQLTIPKDQLASSYLKIGLKISIEELSKQLYQLGYRRTSIVRENGEFAIRGSILDIFPAAQQQGFRIDFFGDDIETIREFSPATQRSHQHVEELTLVPATEVLLNAVSIERFRKNYREIAPSIEKADLLYQSISNGAYWPGMENWLPLFYEKLDSLFDYTKDLPIVLSHQFDEIHQTNQDAIKDYYQARLSQKNNIQKGHEGEIYIPADPTFLFDDSQDWQQRIKTKQCITLSPFIENEEHFHLESQSIPRFYEGAAHHISIGERIKIWMKEQNIQHFIVFSKNPNMQTRLERLLRDTNGPPITLIKDLKSAKKVPSSQLALLRGRLSHGLIIGSTALISDDDILGKSHGSARRNRPKAEDIITQASALNEGDYIVHVEHGVGRYEGLEAISALGAPHDCLKILYAGNDRLYVPVENLELLSRYGHENEHVTLDKLGGSAWQMRKAKAKKRITEMADHLMDIAAQREIKKGAIMVKQEGAYEEFCSRFAYRETDDQWNAINDVIQDLTSGRVTDRLICGDVGFGKTEVALRAAFLSAMSGYQVALIVPTTLLSRQHFKNFKQRFEGFPIHIAQLSRLVSTKEAKQTKENLKKGLVDIVIGTHSLLAKDIDFKNLGLVIVDEEQHFGVSHKEKLKGLRSNTHVLTLTATPIPRTLQMALTGVRDLSIIATPPVDRLAVRTFIQAYDPVVVKDAILKEKYRGGQSFFVCPRLKDIQKMETKLRQLLPEIKFGIAHGQMPVKELEETITAFIDKKFDVLLSTQIVESGIDMPNVNTIIIYRADMFGLSQLYQLRGRVGRSDVRAWAWLVTEPNRHINKSALQRLEVMQTLDNLGAGFSVASHDLDQRGAGNLLGEEQSGHIKEVGMELYQKMLEEAVAKAKNNEVSEEDYETWSTRININLAIIIPTHYIADLDIRMSMYRKIANITLTEELEDIATELQDRFGDLPQEVENLLSITAVKQRCKQIGIKQLDIGPKALVIKFYNDQFKKPIELLHYIQSNVDSTKLRPDQSVVFFHSPHHEQNALLFVNKILEILENMLESKPS